MIYAFSDRIWSEVSGENIEWYNRMTDNRYGENSRLSGDLKEKFEAGMERIRMEFSRQCHLCLCVIPLGGNWVDHDCGPDEWTRIDRKSE